MGAGPASLCIVAELVQQDLKVLALASHTPDKPWPNTYGIWAEEVESLGMASLLGHRWSNTVSYFGNGLGKDYAFEFAALGAKVLVNDLGSYTNKKG